jgi:membrane-associated phospholipid phosphatase
MTINQNWIIKKTILIGILIIIGISTFFIDVFLKELINDIKNPIYDYLFGWSNYSIFLIIICFLFSALYLWNNNKKEWIIPYFFTFIITFTLILIINLIVAKERPIDNLNMLFQITKYSFPCIFTTICFSFVGVFENISKKIFYFWLFFGIIIIISKLFLMQNYLSDLFIAGLIGYAIGFGIFIIKEKYNLFGVNI